MCKGIPESVGPWMSYRPWPAKRKHTVGRNSSLCYKWVLGRASLGMSEQLCPKRQVQYFISPKIPWAHNTSCCSQDRFPGLPSQILQSQMGSSQCRLPGLVEHQHSFILSFYASTTRNVDSKTSGDPKALSLSLWRNLAERDFQCQTHYAILIYDFFQIGILYWE